MRLVLLLLLLCPTAYAQTVGILYGRVVDDLGDPLPGANVMLQGTQLGAATDIDGNYVITEVPPGEYVVQAAFVDYIPVTETIEVVAGRTHWLSFSYELVTQEMLYWEAVRRNDPGCDTDYAWNWLWLREPFLPRAVSGKEIECMPIAR